jgi:uncharacterized protein (TIGR03086 family)
MSEVADRYRRLSTDFAAKVAAVPPDAWADPTPCPDWTARDLVGHVVQTQGMFLGFVGREMPPIPSVDDDPLAAFNAARDVVQADLDDPERATAEFDGFFGRTTFEESVGRFLCFDFVVHGWDLARATVQHERIDPDDVRAIFEAARQFGDAMRGPGAFGPELDAPEGADEQTRLLAFLGRRA